MAWNDLEEMLAYKTGQNNSTGQTKTDCRQGHLGTGGLNQESGRIIRKVTHEGKASDL